jgi:hypothetical protein
VKAGYQSHYVVTGGDGMPCTGNSTKFDEIVISQEAQVMLSSPSLQHP